jgi:hypothetical protein
MPGLKMGSRSSSCLNHEKEGKAKHINFTTESVVFLYKNPNFCINYLSLLWSKVLALTDWVCVP